MSLLIVLSIVLSVAHEPVTTKVKFNKEVIRTFQRNCLSCHSAGGVSSISLASYEEARPWARAIKEMLLEKHMPPWPVVKGYDNFLNSPTISHHEISQIVDWADGGAPKGDTKDLPSKIYQSNEWQLGQPSIVWKLKNRRKYLFPIKESLKIKAIDFLPTPSSGVHCAEFYLNQGRGRDLIGVWIPGQKTISLPDDLAFMARAGSTLEADLHFIESYKRVDPGEIGLYVSDGENGIQTKVISNRELIIDKNSRAVAIRPIVHPNLVSFEAIAYRPDSTVEVLIWTTGYQFSWQPIYYFRENPALPAGTRVEVKAEFNPNIERPIIGFPERSHHHERPVRALCQLFLADN
jgi:hypothetical protein